MYKEDPTQGIPDWLQPFTVHLEDWKKCARTSFWKSELRFGRWRFKSGDRKRSIPLTEEICDTKTVEHNSESRNNHQFAAVVQDLTIQWILRRRIYERFLEPSQKPKVIDMNQFMEFSKSCKELSWNRTSCKSSKEGTSAVLLQSGLNEKWWSHSMTCYYYLQNVQNLLTNGNSQIWTKIWWVIQRNNYVIWRVDEISPKTQRETKQEVH